ncbi:MAG: ABC transporter substrate-binding protein [SAR324 cluster bacterium]|nr:ABC transporter substrate-binding protein [SAR324 cluster bacterium]
MIGKLKILSLALMALLVAGVFAASSAYAVEVKDNEQYIPVLTYKTGPFAPGGSGTAGGNEDYMTLLNLRDGGIGGVKLVFEECLFGYNTDRGVECYERLKKKGKYGAPVFHPFSTGVTYALIERATRDKIPIISMGYGRTDATDGTIFPYIFPLITNYWSQNSAKIRYIASKAGGEDKLKGMKIVNLHLKHPYGQETIPILNALSKRFGFKVTHLPVPWPGIDQKSLWLQIKRIKPDWVINRNWGVSCTVPLKEAARIGFPRNRILGVWWCGSEEDVIPAGKAAKGYVTTNFHGVGTDFPVIQEIFEVVYGQMKGNIAPSRVGSVYYNRGIIQGVVTTEAIRTAQGKYGKRPIGGKEMQWALENLNITKERIAELGATGLVPPLKTSWRDHEGGVGVLIQQWDGEKWNRVSDWIDPYRDFVKDMIMKSAAKYAKEKGIKRRMKPSDGI